VFVFMETEVFADLWAFGKYLLYIMVLFFAMLSGIKQVDLKEIAKKAKDIMKKQGNMSLYESIKEWTNWGLFCLTKAGMEWEAFLGFQFPEKEEEEKTIAEQIDEAEQADLYSDSNDTSTL
jgi:hypothetical protein